jgi:type IV secretory pathway component VirB8
MASKDNFGFIKEIWSSSSILWITFHCTINNYNKLSFKKNLGTNMKTISSWNIFKWW